jgi:hypothetical protein
MLIEIFCLSGGWGIPRKICDIGFETPCIDMVHSVSADIMGSHTVYKPLFILNPSVQSIGRNIYILYCICLLLHTMPRVALNFNSCKLDNLFFPTCWASPCPTLRIYLMSWFITIFALCTHNFVIRSYNRWIMKATCKSPIVLRRKKTC